MNKYHEEQLNNIKAYIERIEKENNNLKEDFKRHIDRINELEKDNKILIEALESNDTNMTSNQQEIFDKYYLKDKNNGN